MSGRSDPQRRGTDDRSDVQRRAEETMRRLQHEVRTPIGQIIGYSELVEEELSDRGDEELAPDLRRIREAAQRLLDLVDGRLQEDAGAPPLPEPEPGDEAPAPAAPTDERASRVLVIDADPNDRELLARRLGREGFEVDLAPDGVDGLRRIESADYDLVLCEVLLPRMNGLEVVERVRRSRSRSELPILLVTALDGSDDVVEGLERGANDYLTKPLDFPVVRARVRSQLEAHRVARELAGLARQLEFRSAFIKQALGREVSDDVLVETAERPDAASVGGDVRRVVAVAAGLRGTRSAPPRERAALVKSALDGLVDVVSHAGGVLDSVSDDGLVALFGLPVPREDDEERAVACALALQLEADEIHERHRRDDLPELELCVGVARGEVVVVGLGSGDERRYKAIGDAPLRANEIQRQGSRGEVWICDATRRVLESVVRLDAEREATLPGDATPARLHRTLGLGGARLISLRDAGG